MRRTKGFTLIEMMLTISIIGLLLGLSAPVYASFLQRNDLSLTAQSVTAMLRRAELYARANKANGVWSVEIQSTTVTLFQGTSFAARNTAYDETLSIPGSVGVSGLGEIQFAKLTAAPNITGTITLSGTNNTKVITINAKGTISY